MSTDLDVGPGAVAPPGLGRHDRALPAPTGIPATGATAGPSCDAPEPEAPAGAASPNWPRSLLVQAGLMLALAVGAALPLGQDGPAVRLAVPVVLAAVATWLAFEAFAPAQAGSDIRRWAFAVIAGATGAVVDAASALVLGLPVTVALLPASAGVGVAVLVLAVKLRSAELRLRARVRRLVLVGSAGQRSDLALEISRSGDALAGWLPLDRALGLDPHVLSEDILAARPTVLVLSEEAIREPRVVAAASAVNLRGVRVRSLRGFYEQEFRKVAVSELSPAWFLFDIAEIHRRTLYGGVKRLVESVLAAALLLATAPLLPLIALGILLSSPGGVLFSQERVGRHGRVFRLAKFRTMHADPAREHGAWLDASASRIFPLGAMLRKFRLDELPQLVNVIRGDLSLVGPRPEQPAIVARLEHAMPFYSARHSVRPGLTGWAQVNFGYGGSDEGALSKLQYDLFYIKRQSLLLDLRILAATVRTVLLGAGR